MRMIFALIRYQLRMFCGILVVQIAEAVEPLDRLFGGVQWLRSKIEGWPLTTLLPWFAIALIVLFRAEIRRTISQFRRILSLVKVKRPKRNASGLFDDIVLAAEYFSQNRIGA